jgi:hypothetical protein
MNESRDRNVTSDIASTPADGIILSPRDVASCSGHFSRLDHITASTSGKPIRGHTETS